jgi:hypothetical protein
MLQTDSAPSPGGDGAPVDSGELDAYEAELT